MKLLQIQGNRPYPPPAEPWIMWQAWSHLLFAHWTVTAEALRPFIPDTLQVDTYEGMAWLGVIPFEVLITPRGLHHTPLKHHFNEINVRTYVTYQNHHPGIYFFSLDANDVFSVLGARLTYRLPYYDAKIKCTYHNGTTYYRSARRRETNIGFSGCYQPTSDVFQSLPGSLEYWLTERYCLYTRDPKNHLYVGEIHHPPWQLQRAKVDITSNTMADFLSLDSPTVPVHILYAKYQEMLAWPLRQLT